MRRFLLAAPLILLGATLARADAPGGFTDCDKAATADEKAICGNINLIQEDARMVTMFEIAQGFVGMGTRGALNDAQADWLARRHACKADVGCLGKIYGVRIREIQKVLDDAKAHGPF